MRHTMYVFLNYDTLKSEYFDMYQSVIQDLKSVKIVKTRWVSGKAWSYYMYVLEVNNPDIAAFIYKLNSCYEVVVTDADRLKYVTSDTCSKAVEEELYQNKHSDINDVINRMAGKPVAKESDDKLLKDFLGIVKEVGYERIAQEIEDSYKEKLSDKTMHLGSYGSTRYVFLAQPISEKPIVFIREFDKKIGKTITSDGVVQEYRF